ncbi:transmembrane and coiled-coil domains protein 1-like, partial [Carlito syrichta]|uniref:Transmembrane and coiled-coil domains protein 1-like n=1 Tax=Carlito syrichta TaxID=1868482 RepID=A0A1U7U8Y8_CARSF
MEPSGSEQLYEDPDPGGKSQDAEARKQTESEQKLSKMTHNALENINVIGQGLKHLFQHQRRRSSVSPHDVQQIQTDLEPEVDLESQNTCAEIDGVPTHPTALNRVLQQIRVPPKMKRGTSLHSRRGKPEAPKGSPQINRKSGQEMTAVMQTGRPRSSSTTDAPTSSAMMEIACAAAAACLPGDEGTTERVAAQRYPRLMVVEREGVVLVSGPLTADSQEVLEELGTGRSGSRILPRPPALSHVGCAVSSDRTMKDFQ